MLSLLWTQNFVDPILETEPMHYKAMIPVQSDGALCHILETFLWMNKDLPYSNALLVESATTVNVQRMGLAVYYTAAHTRCTF